VARVARSSLAARMVLSYFSSAVDALREEHRATFSL
jgi:hypothetical protein